MPLTINECFYTLVREHEIRSRSAEWDAIMMDPKHYEMLEAMAQAFDCQIRQINDGIYLIPNEGNTFLGFSRTRLRETLIRPQATLTEHNLYMFIILVMLSEFYGTEYGRSHKRDYLTLDGLVKCVSAALETGVQTQQKDAEIPYEKLSGLYNAWQDTIEDSQKRTSKYYHFNRILKFLEKQKLIDWLDDPDQRQIRCTARLDDLMGQYMRDEEHNKQMIALIKEVQHAASE